VVDVQAGAGRRWILCGQTDGGGGSELFFICSKMSVVRHLRHTEIFLLHFKNVCAGQRFAVRIDK
jgi:hypothetical protein